MAKITPALVLCDVPVHGLAAGQIVEAGAALLKALEGSLDAHKDAVAHAREHGAVVVARHDEPAAP